MVSPSLDENSDIAKYKQSRSDYYKEWYQKNKERLSEKRKARYETDPAFRQAVLERSANFKKMKAAGIDVKPDVYKYSFSDVAEEFGITLSMLRNWYKNGYFPTPAKYRGQLWFTEHQKELLGQINNYLVKYQVNRVSNVHRSALQSIAALIHALWEE